MKRTASLKPQGTPGVFELTNESPIGADNGGSELAPGLYHCNESRFTASHLSEPLTAYGIGWTDPEDLEGLLDTVAPAVSAPRRFSYLAANNTEVFLTEDDDVRAIGSDFKEVRRTGTSVDASTQNKGLMMCMDPDEPLMTEEEAVAYLRKRLARNELKRSIALLDAAATNVAKTWSSTSDPDQDIEDAADTGGDARGMDSDTVVMGIAAWRIRKRAYRAMNTAAGFASASMTPQEVADSIMVDRVVPVKARYQSSASAKTKLIANYVYVYMAPRGITRDDPSNIKRFVTNTLGGGRFAVYRWEAGPKRIYVAVEHYSRTYITSTLGIAKRTISAS